MDGRSDHHNIILYFDTHSTKIFYGYSYCIAGGVCWHRGRYLFCCKKKNARSPTRHLSAEVLQESIRPPLADYYIDETNLLIMKLILILSSMPFLPHVLGFHSRSSLSTGPYRDTVPTCVSAEAQSTAADDDVLMKDALALLTRAAKTKKEDSDAVVGALLDLERLKRREVKNDAISAQYTLESLAGNGGGSWRLIFTTGTVNTQMKTGRINYFPLKATQSFNIGEEPWLIENGICLGDFPLLKFKGDFDWTVQKSGVTKLTFDFNSLTVLNLFDVQLKSGEAANLGAKTGLGSEGNVELEKKGKRAFFNWISADSQIATARGGGGGLALWMKVDYEGGL